VSFCVFLSHRPIRAVACVLLFLLVVPFVQAESQKVTVQLEWKFQFEFAGFIAAREKGFYREAGLDVELIEYQSGMDPLGRIMRGEVDYGVHNSSIVIDDGEVQPSVILATYLQRSPLVLVTRPDIESPSDLEGRTIMGTSHELANSSLALLLAHFYISKDNAQFVEHTFNIDDFVAGKVDVMTAFRSNQLFELNRQGIDYNVLDPADYGFVTNAVSVISARDTVMADPDQARRFVEATNRGWVYALEHAEEVIDLIVEHYSDAKSKDALRFEAAATRELMLLDFFPVGAVSQELIDRSYKQLKRAGLITVEGREHQLTLDEVLKIDEGANPLEFAQLNRLRERGKIQLCVSADRRPIEELRNGLHQGIVADLMAEHVLPHMPVPLEATPLPMDAQRVDVLLAEQCDVITAISETRALTEKIALTEPYMRLPLVMATATDTLFIEDLTEVSGRPIGIPANSAIRGLLEQRYGNALNLIDVPDAQSGLSRVVSGNLFGYIDVLQVLANQISSSFAAQLKVSARVPDELSLRFGVRRDDPELLAIFERLALSLSHDEALQQRVIQKWVTITPESGIRPETLFRGIGIALLVLAAMLLHYFRLRKYSRRMEELSIRDPLTKLYNRMRSDEVLQDCFERFKRYGERTGLIMIDVDHFKQVNDQFGHQVGDQVLIQFASIIQKSIRVTDVACRWGGEEFLVICPHLDGDETARVANKVLDVVRHYNFPVVNKVTASMGVAAFTTGQSLEQVIRLVDDRLYEAKRSGRNRIVASEHIAVESTDA